MFEWEKEHVPEWLWRGNRRKPYWIITRGLSVALTVSGYYVILPVLIDFLGLSPLGPRNLLISTSIFASALLTFALIAVYRDMGETQQLQTETLQNQEELLEISRRPYIEVVGFDFDDSERIFISNFGNGVALEISLVVKLQFPEQDGFSPSICLKPVSRVDDADMRRQDRSLPPGREEVGFDLKGCLAFNEDGETESMPIPHGIAKMMRAGVEGCQYQLYVQYYNILGEMGLSKATAPKHLPLQTHMSSIGQMEANSDLLHTWGEDIEFEELEPSDMISEDEEVLPEPNII